MNKFMRWLLNVPNGDLVNVFRMDYDYAKDKFNCDDILQKIRYIYNVDIKSIVEQSVSEVDKGTIMGNVCMTKYFRKLIQNLDKAIGPKNTEYIEETIGCKLNTAKTVNGKIEYILCNIYQIIMSIYYTKEHEFSELSENFADLVYTEDDCEKEKNKKKDPVSVNSVRKHLKDHYKHNILSFLFLPKSTFDKKLNADPDSVGNILKNNYCYTEAMEEIQIATVLTGTKNMYNNKYIEENKYSLNKLKTFNKKYYSVLGKVSRLQSKQYFNGEISEKMKIDSLHCITYISDMIYAFNLTSYMAIHFEKMDSEVVDHICKMAIFEKMCSSLIQLPDIQRRRDYFSAFLQSFKCKNIHSGTKVRNMIDNDILYEARIYYPLLILSAMLCLYRIANKQSIDKRPASFFLNNVSGALSAIGKNLSVFKDLYPIYEKNNKASNAVTAVYENIITEFLNIHDFKKLGLKITMYDIEMHDFIEYLLKLEDDMENHIKDLFT